MKDIELTSEETVEFLNNMRYPKEETLAKRDAFLSDMAGTTRTVNADGSVLMEVPSLDLSFLKKR